MAMDQKKKPPAFFPPRGRGPAIRDHDGTADNGVKVIQSYPIFSGEWMPNAYEPSTGHACFVGDAREGMFATFTMKIRRKKLSEGGKRLRTEYGRKKTFAN